MIISKIILLCNPIVTAPNPRGMSGMSDDEQFAMRLKSVIAAIFYIQK
jgi:hypothetical protein